MRTTAGNLARAARETLQGIYAAGFAQFLMNPLPNVFRSGVARQYDSRELEELLRALHQLSTALARETDPDTLLSYAVQSAAAGTHASRAIALLYKRAENAFVGRAPAPGFVDEEADRLRVGIGECADLDAAFFRGTNACWPSADRSIRPPTILSTVGASNVLIARLRSGDENTGALCLFDKSRKFGSFGAIDLAFAETVSAQLQTALAAARTASSSAPTAAAAPPRRRFDDFAALEIERAEKLGHALGCIVIEVVGFGDIIAKYGRQTAEFAVTELADCVRENARHIDVVARDDAQTLIVLLPGTDAEAISAFWSRLAAEIDAMNFQSVGKLQVRHGLACYPGSSDSPVNVVLSALKELRSTPAA